MTNPVTTETFPIVNNIYTLTKITAYSPTISPPTPTDTEHFIKTNFSELIYNNIIKSINAILRKNNILKMPIVYHNNIYIIEHATDCPINNIKHPDINHNNTTFYVNYDATKTTNLTDFVSTISSTTSATTSPTTSPTTSQTTSPTTIHFNKTELLDNNIMYPTICNFIYKKTFDIITTLNKQLNNHNIKIKKAQLPFCVLGGYKEMISSYPLDSPMLTDIIFLKPLVDVFEMFEFENLNATQQITDPYVIHNALTDNKPIEIEAYKTVEEIIYEFKTHVLNIIM